MFVKTVIFLAFLGIALGRKVLEIQTKTSTDNDAGGV